MASQSRFANRSDWLAPSWDGRFCDFVEHLKNEGLSEGRVRTLRLGTRHFLLWLDRQGIPVEAVDHGVLCGFRRHDCHCPGMTEQHRLRVSSGKRGFMTGALRLVRFLEEEGQIEHPGEMAHNLGYLDGFLARCAEKGYGPDALASYGSACRHVLIWLHQSRLSIRDVGAETLDRFRDHDCVCTTETLRRWVREAERDSAARPGMTSDDRERVRVLEREVRELRQANEILRKSSAWFAQAELDRPLKR